MILLTAICCLVLMLALPVLCRNMRKCCHLLLLGTFQWMWMQWTWSKLQRWRRSSGGLPKSKLATASSFHTSEWSEVLSCLCSCWQNILNRLSTRSILVLQYFKVFCQEVCMHVDVNFAHNLNCCWRSLMNQGTCTTCSIIGIFDLSKVRVNF